MVFRASFILVRAVFQIVVVVLGLHVRIIAIHIQHGRVSTAQPGNGIAGHSSAYFGGGHSFVNIFIYTVEFAQGLLFRTVIFFCFPFVIVPDSLFHSGRACGYLPGDFIQFRPGVPSEVYGRLKGRPSILSKI